MIQSRLTTSIDLQVNKDIFMLKIGEKRTLFQNRDMTQNEYICCIHKTRMQTAK